MTKKRQIVIIVLCILLVLVAVTMVILYMLVWERTERKVVGLGKNDSTTFETRNFQKSYFNFYGTGTFDVSIIFSANDKDTVFFVGIGKYEKKGDKYTLTFEDAWGLTNIGESTTSFVDVKNIMNANSVYKTSGNQLIFIDHNGQIYYFR